VHHGLAPDAPFQLLRGNSLHVLRSLPDNSVDAIITDPPYSSGGLHMTSRTQKNTATKYIIDSHKQPDLHNFSGDNRDQRSWTMWCTLWLSEALRVAKPGAPVVLFTDWRQLAATTDVLQAAGATWRGVFPWVKPAGRPGGPGRFRNAAEFAVWGSNGEMPRREDLAYLPGYHVEAEPDEIPFLMGFHEESVRQKDKHHITGKPTNLMRTIVQACPVGGVILDPFAGSGTTGVGALLEGRRFIGIELDDTNAGIAEARLIDAAQGVLRAAA
jgi:site-specific DNA-methyltransferase (adenine-specific)